MKDWLPYINIGLLILLWLSVRQTEKVSKLAARACEQGRRAIDYADQMAEGNKALIRHYYEHILLIYPKESWPQHPPGLRRALAELEEAYGRAMQRPPFNPDQDAKQ